MRQLGIRYLDDPNDNFLEWLDLVLDATKVIFNTPLMGENNQEV